MMENPLPSSDPTPDAAPSPAKRGWFASFGFLFRDLFLAVILAGVIILFVYRPVKVEGTSMMPTLSDQERIFINQFVYRFTGDVERGDTVVFWYPQDTSKSYVKRVIGLPGDTVRVEEGDVYVNDRKLPESYVPPEFKDMASYPEVRVPPDHYYVMGDHRSSSNDSRAWGTVPRRYIYGKAVFVYWPLEKMGTVR
ncbi:MAG: signal peptidase I [Acidobacteria bacterium]|nr:signal peptidase I [Acidobacteriota bacterium]